jgi:hypothetical protein
VKECGDCVGDLGGHVAGGLLSGGGSGDGVQGMPRMDLNLCGASGKFPWLRRPMSNKTWKCGSKNQQRHSRSGEAKHHSHRGKKIIYEKKSHPHACAWDA